ncbi:hypothetical protein ACSSS7_001566 [Eimeria intestinalis]
MAAACGRPLAAAGIQLPPASMLLGGKAAGSPPCLPASPPPPQDAGPPLEAPDSVSSGPSPLLSAAEHEACPLSAAEGQLLLGGCTSLKAQMRAPLRRKLNSEGLRRCLEMPLQACEGPPRRDGMQTKLKLLQLPIEEAHLPLSGFGVLLPEVAEDCLIRGPLGSSSAGSPSPAPACVAPERSASKIEQVPLKAKQGASAAGAPRVAAVGEAQESDDAAVRRQLVHAAKRFQRRRRLLLQQVRNRLMAVMQQISDLQEAKEAAEGFVEDLKREVAALRAERQQERREGSADQAPQQQQQQPYYRVYFDSRPPPSSQQLVRHPRVEEARPATEEEVSSDAGDASQSHDGSAHVERLMQRYYATLMAEVDQAAREHARVAAQGGGGTRGDEGPGGFAEGPHSDAAAAAGGPFLPPYYFDPFAPSQGLAELPRRGQQAQAAAAGGGVSAYPLTTAAAGLADGSANYGAPLGHQAAAAALASKSHPMLSAAAEKVRGVAFCKSNRYWICTRMEHGKQQCRYFSVKHLGFERARRQAILLRQQWKGDVNEEVLKALEEEKAAMDAAAAAAGAAGAVPGASGTAGGSSARGRHAGGDALSPASKVAASPSPSVPSPSKGPQQVVASPEALPPPRKEKTGSVKRRRDALSRPLIVDRSGSMPRPPAEFDFGSDSDFLTAAAAAAEAAFVAAADREKDNTTGGCYTQEQRQLHLQPSTSKNEDDREEEALAMNATLLAECAERSLHGAPAEEEEAASQPSAEARLRQKRREIVSSHFMGISTTADALVLLSRRLTHAVKIPGISFHKGVESWLCTWKEPDSRTISRYFRCSRFGFRRGFKLSVFTLLLNAPRAAAVRAFMAIKEIKRRRRATSRGESYSPQEPPIEKSIACDVLDSSERTQALASRADLPEGPSSLALSALAAGVLPSGVAEQAAKQQGAVDVASFSVEALGFPGSHLGALVEGPSASFAATPSTNPSVHELASRQFQDEAVLNAGQFAVASSDLGERRAPSLAGEAAGPIAQEGLVSQALAAPFEIKPQD